MARAPSLAGSSLTPFGGGGGSFGAFSIVDPGREAYIAFIKIENSWQLGQTSDTAYLAALKVYRDAQIAGSSEQSNIDQRLADTTYRVNRNVLANQVNNHERTTADLLAFDQAALSGMATDSQAYRERLNTYQNTQQQVFSEAEKVVVQQYQNGTVTTTQLQSWYASQKPTYQTNPDLYDALTARVTELDQRVLDERDSLAASDYSAGKMSDSDFLAYASAARARYASGTSQANDWDKRIQAAQNAQAEDGMLYRYGLSQQYAQLEQFVASNSAKAGGKSTSTTKRTILDASGHWVTVTSTSTSTTKPSAAQQAAYKNLLVQLADAKKQMAEIVAKVGGAPDQGGWVSTDSVINYYTGRQAELVKGSADWYAMQQKIDGLQQAKHAEQVLTGQGIKITYPSTGSSPSSTTHSTAADGTPKPPTSNASTSAASAPTLDSFLHAISKQESGGRYDARNASGAYGKYQIMPANWPAWAAKYIGSANAPQTPDNQEKVARGKMTDLYNWLGSWSAVAYWWNNGGTKAQATNPANWNTRATGYVNNVMGTLGQAPVKASVAGPSHSTAPTTKPTTAPAAKPGYAGLSQATGVYQTELDPNSVGASKPGPSVVSNKPTAFPANMDSRQFESFFSAYAAAFKSGAETFVDTSSGRPVAYFIGQDANDRIARMRTLDDLRINLYTEKANAYVGTPTEVTASNQRNNAYQDAAAHEYQILDTLIRTRPAAAGSPTTTAPDQGAPGSAANPIAAGIRMLDQISAGVDAEVKAATAAYKRGDVNAAYAHMQLARTLSIGLGAGAAGKAGAYAAAANAAVSAIQARYGGITPDEALGGKASTLNKDLERLTNYQSEIDKLFAPGTEFDKLGAEMKPALKTDSRGNVVLDGQGQVQLGEGWARFADANSNVKIEHVPTSGIDPKTGNPVRVPDGMVKSTIRVGSTVEDVYAKWVVGTVGYIRNTANPNQPIPIKGKLVTMLVNGQEQTFYENPLDPGHWSNSAIVFNAPGNMSLTPNPDGSVTPSFQGKSGTANGNTTFSLQFDPKTGTYLVLGNAPKDWMGGGEMVNAVVGGAGDANVLALLTDIGLVRDNTTLNGGGFTNNGLPVFGMTPNQYTTWLKGPAPVVSRPDSRYANPMNAKPIIYSGDSRYANPMNAKPPTPTADKQPTTLASLPAVKPLGMPTVNAATGFTVQPPVTTGTPTPTSHPASTSGKAGATSTAPAADPRYANPMNAKPLPKVAPLPLVKPGQAPVAS